MDIQQQILKELRQLAGHFDQMANQIAGRLDQIDGRLDRLEDGQEKIAHMLGDHTNRILDVEAGRQRAREEPREAV